MYFVMNKVVLNVVPESFCVGSVRPAPDHTIIILVRIPGVKTDEQRQSFQTGRMLLSVCGYRVNVSNILLSVKYYDS